MPLPEICLHLKQARFFVGKLIIYRLQNEIQYFKELIISYLQLFFRRKQDVVPVCSHKLFSFSGVHEGSVLL